MSVEAGNDAAPATRGLWAWTFYDWANQSFATVIQTFVFAAYFTNQLSANAEQGTVRWSMTIGITGFVVAVCGPVLGAIADRTGRRKPWLGAFTLLCALADKSTAFMGPLMVAGVTALTDSQRVGLITIPFFLILGWWVLWGTRAVNAGDSERSTD